MREISARWLVSTSLIRAIYGQWLFDSGDDPVIFIYQCLDIPLLVRCKSAILHTSAADNNPTGFLDGHNAVDRMVRIGYLDVIGGDEHHVLYVAFLAEQVVSLYIIIGPFLVMVVKKG